MFDSLVSQWGALVGFAALIALVINIGKTMGWVADGQAQNWSAALNLAGMIGLLALRVFRPDIVIEDWDAKAAELAVVLNVVFGYVLQLLASKLTHRAVSGVPLIGKTNSEPAG